MKTKLAAAARRTKQTIQDRRDDHRLVKSCRQVRKESRKALEAIPMPPVTAKAE